MGDQRVWPTSARGVPAWVSRHYYIIAVLGVSPFCRSGETCCFWQHFSNEERLKSAWMFPLHSAPTSTRLRIEQGQRGEAHRGPAAMRKMWWAKCSADYITLSAPPLLKLKFLSRYCFQMMLFLQPMDRRPRSSNGWYFGATSGPRLHRERDVSACWLVRVTSHDNGVWSCRITCQGPADYSSQEEDMTTSDDKRPGRERGKGREGGRERERYDRYDRYDRPYVDSTGRQRVRARVNVTCSAPAVKEF